MTRSNEDELYVANVASGSLHAAACIVTLSEHFFTILFNYKCIAEHEYKSKGIEELKCSRVHTSLVMPTSLNLYIFVKIVWLMSNQQRSFIFFFFFFKSFISILFTLIYTHYISYNVICSPFLYLYIFVYVRTNESVHCRCNKFTCPDFM